MASSGSPKFMHPIYICEVELLQLILPLVVIYNPWVSPTYKGLNISSSVDCGPPPAPRNVSLESYTNTTEGSVVFYSCDPGLVPERRMMSLCTGSGWSPNPAVLNCSVGMFKWQVPDESLLHEGHHVLTCNN